MTFRLITCSYDCDEGHAFIINTRSDDERNRHAMLRLCPVHKVPYRRSNLPLTWIPA